MDATANFSLKFTRASESKVETTDWVLSRLTLQRISTGMSLISLALGFWVFAMLILINGRQAELNGLSGGSSVAIVGGIGASLVGMVFLVAACLHWRFCVRHPVALPVRRQSFRFTFARPNPLTAIAVLSS
jgi:uncharacterized integral membrane protein